MIVVNSDDLANFLNDELKSRSNADSQSLTRYVIALLKKKRKENELRTVLLDALDVFLGKETAPFVDLLLDALKSESYMNGTTPRERTTDAKKEFHEKNINRTHTNDERGRQRRIESAPVSVSLPSNLENDQKIMRCKDYDQVGYCIAGNSCSFSHGVDALVVDGDGVHDIFPKPTMMVPHAHDLMPPLPSFPPLPPLPPEPPLAVYPPPPPPLHPLPEAYNPEHPGMDGPPHPQFKKRELVVLPLSHNISAMPNERLVKRKAFDYNRLGPKEKFFKKNEKHTPNNLKIEITKLPTSLNNISHLNSLFSKFGTITNIEIGAQSSIIKFEDPSQAEKAFKYVESNFQLFYNGEKRWGGEGPFVCGTVDNTKETKTIPLFSKKERVKPPRASFAKFNLKDNGLEKRLQFVKKKQSLLESRIKYYKVLVQKIADASNKEKEKGLKDILETLADEILKLKNEIKEDSMELKKSLQSAGKKPMMNMHSEKALLDFEMDFYKRSLSGGVLRSDKSSKDADKGDLLFEVGELKEKAKGFGLFRPNSNELEKTLPSDEINSAKNSVQDEQPSAELSSDISKSNSLLLGDDEEEDEEEDSEARSWRR